MNCAAGDTLEAGWEVQEGWNNEENPIDEAR